MFHALTWRGKVATFKYSHGIIQCCARMRLWHVSVALEKHCPVQKSDKHLLQGDQNTIWLSAIFYEPKF